MLRHNVTMKIRETPITLHFNLQAKKLIPTGEGKKIVTIEYVLLLNQQSNSKLFYMKIENIYISVKITTLNG